MSPILSSDYQASIPDISVGFYFIIGILVGPVVYQYPVLLCTMLTVAYAVARLPQHVERTINVSNTMGSHIATCSMYYTLYAACVMVGSAMKVPHNVINYIYGASTGIPSKVYRYGDHVMSHGDTVLRHARAYKDDTTHGAVSLDDAYAAYREWKAGVVNFIVLMYSRIPTYQRVISAVKQATAYTDTSTASEHIKGSGPDSHAVQPLVDMEGYVITMHARASSGHLSCTLQECDDAMCIVNHTMSDNLQLRLLLQTSLDDKRIYMRTHGKLFDVVHAAQQSYDELHRDDMSDAQQLASDMSMARNSIKFAESAIEVTRANHCLVEHDTNTAKVTCLLAKLADIRSILNNRVSTIPKLVNGEHLRQRRNAYSPDDCIFQDW